MVTGLDFFTEYFKDYKESYILIGGAATYRWLDLAGFPYRVTKDLDINQRIINEDWKNVNGKSRLIKDMKKHRSDIFRIALVLTPDDTIELKEPIKGDVMRFMEEIEKNLRIIECWKRILRLKN